MVVSINSKNHLSFLLVIALAIHILNHIRCKCVLQQSNDLRVNHLSKLSLLLVSWCKVVSLACQVVRVLILHKMDVHI